MKQATWLTVIGFIITTFGCSKHMANLRYAEFKDMPVKAESLAGRGKILGAVSGDAGGAIWNDCTDKARESVNDMISKARGLGANAIGDVKWESTETSEAGCKKGWGYLVIWPFILTPLFMSTRVDGTAYKIDGGKTGMFMIPASPEGDKALIENILAQK